MGFQYNQESAMKAGGTAKEGGAYLGHIKSAEYKIAKSGSRGLELTFETKDGSEFNYLTLWYQKADNSEIRGGSSMINAIMGLTQVQNLSEKQVGVDQQTRQAVFVAPELVGKDIGLLLQKVLYTKIDKSDGYKFEIRLPFSLQTRQTLKEQISNAQPEMVDRMLSTLADKDERQASASTQPPAQSFGNPSGEPAPQSFNVPDDAFDNLESNQGGFGN